jgi:hypothetical protein
MKFTINVDCTPEEARRFFGLPDVDQMNSAMQENMKMWMPQNYQHFQELQQMIWDQMGAAMTGGAKEENTMGKDKK